jgi:hypothetical protein
MSFMLPRPSRTALAAWDNLREEFGGRDGNADDVDPRAPDNWLRSASFSMRVPKPSAIYYFCKPDLVYALGTRWKAALPDDAILVMRTGVAAAHCAAIVRREAIRCRSRVRFVGDLDPQDLAIYLGLAFGDYSMRPNPRTAVPLVHTGINDAWLAAAERAFRADPRWSNMLEWVALPMTVAEQSYLTVLEQLGPPLEEWVGPRCASLLRGGKKIEVEAFLNSPADPRSYARALGLPRRGPRRSRTRA